MLRRGFVILGAAAGLLSASGALAQTDPLPSWNDAASKKAILDFVSRTTTTGGADYVPIDRWIATFDNDGTLWTEQPISFQVAFAIDRVKALAPLHPEWSDLEPFKSMVEGTHTGMTVEEFSRIVAEWIASARHPRFDRPYVELVYQPMLELMTFLRANQFKTFIVPSGGIEFIGDGAGKPVGINRFIGRRPVFAFGNSDGDQQVLEYTAGGNGPSFMGLVHHTDAAREYAYDRQSQIGRLDKALDEAVKRQWTVVDMKTEWNTIYPFERK